MSVYRCLPLHILMLIFLLLTLCISRQRRRKWYDWFLDTRRNWEQLIVCCTLKFFFHFSSLNAWGRIFPSLFFFFLLHKIYIFLCEGKNCVIDFFHVIFYVSIVLFAFTNLLFVNNALSSSSSSSSQFSMFIEESTRWLLWIS